MAFDFKNSETKENLMRAFAGESQARNRYTFAASQAKELKQAAIAEVFLYTAGQEREHGEVFYNYLKEFNGENICIDACYPINRTDNLAELLSMAQHNEYEEYDDIYRHFGDVAKQEGFDQIAHTFYMIAGIEKTHGDRFGGFAQLIRENRLHISNVSTCWICLSCGYIVDAKEAPKECPVCHHDQGYFIRVEMSPFA